MGVCLRRLVRQLQLGFPFFSQLSLMYSIQLNTATEEGDLSVQVCYPNHEERDFLKEVLEELFEDYNLRLVSSRVLFVCPLGMEQEVRCHFEELRSRVQERLRVVSHITIAPFDHRGRLVPEKIVSLKNGGSHWSASRVSLTKQTRSFEPLMAIYSGSLLDEKSQYF